MEGEKAKERGSMDPRQGHWNQLEWTKAVDDVAFLAKSLQVWRCVCCHCSKWLADPNDPKIVQIDVVSMMLIICAKDRSIVKEASMMTWMKWQWNIQENAEDLNRKILDQVKNSLSNGNKSKKKMKSTAEGVLSICHLLRLDPRHARPDWMIGTVLPLPPMCVRPSVLLFGTARSQNDFTDKLINLLKSESSMMRRWTSAIVTIPLCHISW